jgi:hypothetical protein
MKHPQPLGEPLVIVMQLEGLNKKLDEVIDRLERIEERIATQINREEELRAKKLSVSPEPGIRCSS